MPAKPEARVRVGIGGWTYEPWRDGAFYPVGLPQKQELHFASRALPTIEINATYRSTFKPEVWRRWREETPDDFVFAVKASRYCTNRKVLATAGDGIARFLDQGLTELGPKLGPINWQFMETKKFDREDFAAFLDLLPAERDGVRLRHAVEPRHASFDTPSFAGLVRRRAVAVVYAEDDEFPRIDIDSGGFRYVRLMATDVKLPNGVTPARIAKTAELLATWGRTQDVFAYFISGAKERNPAAAAALLKRLAAQHSKLPK